VRVLVTGGAGFVGANLAVSLANRHADWEIVALDNLKRRGAELNLARLNEADVQFVHGDVRELADLMELPHVDALVECSAEPSALAGVGGATEYVVRANLLGAYHCLELARRDGAQVVFLSTSRVYPVAALNAIAYAEGETRFELAAEQTIPGVSESGISESFPLDGARTFYGTTKLSAELLIAEHASAFDLRVVVDRCGVIAGLWQMGKVDQGVFTYWALNHRLGRELSYVGYEGRGKQVRDLLHVDDLVRLTDEQLQNPDHWAGVTANVGGGVDCSLSLLETTDLCRELTGNEIPIEPAAEDRPGDVPIYISDCSLQYRHTDWRPEQGPTDILRDINDWIIDNERAAVAALT
jgi:CDP-paratose 2-epimerase